MRSAGSSIYVVVLIVCFMPLSAAQDNDSSDLQIEAFGPTHIAIECDIDPCSGFSLEITGFEQTVFEDTRSWSGNASGLLTYIIHEESDAIGSASIIILTSENGFVHEHEDVNGSSGIKDGINSIPTADVCSDNLCESHIFPTKKMSGWFESGGDSDAWLLVSNGIAVVDSIVSEAPFMVEIWKEKTDGTREMVIRSSSNTDETLHTHSSITVSASNDEEAWMVLSATEQDRRDSVYAVELITSDEDGEDSPIHESPRMTTNSFSSYARGFFHFPGDIDSIIVPAAGGVHFEIVDLKDSGEGLSIEIIEHLLDGSTSEKMGNSTGMTSHDTISLEIRITSIVEGEWGLQLTLESESSDFSGSLGTDKRVFVGDAPNRLPKDIEESYLWPMWTVISDQGDYSSSMLRLQGDVSDLDPIDIYLVSVESENGTMIRSDPEMGGANIQIQELRGAADYSIMNSTNGSQMHLPAGMHAIRVEQGSGQEGAYSFIISVTSPPKDDPGAYVDLSSEAMPYYIFAGVFLLTPAFLVVLMMRREIISRILGKGENQTINQEKLESIRNKLEMGLLDNDLEAALDSVEGSGLISARAGFIIEKGLLDREVANVSTSTPLGDIGLWIDDGKEGLLSFGMASNSVWKMACLRLSFPHGPRSEISEVDGEWKFHGDEILIGDLQSGECVMISIKIEPIPEIIEVEVTGRVKGEPVAIVPRKALSWK